MNNDTTCADASADAGVLRGPAGGCEGARSTCTD